MITYRVLVTGSREFVDREAVYTALDRAMWDAYMDLERFIVVHGKCPRGADLIASEWCHAPRVNASYVEVIEEPHPADWTGYGKSAGYVRNAEMVALGANVCLAFYKQGAGNRGTAHCVRTAVAAGIPVRRFYA